MNTHNMQFELLENLGHNFRTMREGRAAIILYDYRYFEGGGRIFLDTKGLFEFGTLLH